MTEMREGPSPATVIEVSEGILWARMPLPFALDHVNLWLLRDGDGWAVVDTGMGDDRTKALWEGLLAGPLEDRPLTRVISTHFHPDHMGLAGWLCPRFGIPLTATQGEWSAGRLDWLDEDHRHLRDHYRKAGCDDAFLLRVGNTYRPRVVPIPPSFSRIADGERLAIGGREWVVMTFGGHSPEHACLWCPQAGVLIAGDQMLPRISPTVGVWPREPDAEPLSRFLAGLERLQALPASTLVLPSHDWPFATLHQRCAQLRIHHIKRLRQTRACCARPATASQVLATLFPRPLDDHQTTFAVAETLAHLNHLVGTGELRRVGHGQDDAPWSFAAS
ncbi:MAG: MBL fold metallo-hydrolase [Magnetospirillum sp.]|nr:MBL fold metallo-hydrolase [Magnetospirillum sp.]